MRHNENYNNTTAQPLSMNKEDTKDLNVEVSYKGICGNGIIDGKPAASLFR